METEVCVVLNVDGAPIVSRGAFRFMQAGADTAGIINGIEEVFAVMAAGVSEFH